MRKAVNTGRAAYTPVFLSDIPRLFVDDYLPLDVALLSVSPPDRHGFCSLGPSVDVASTALRTARKVIAQINPRMPRSHGDGLVHLSALDTVLECPQELPEYPPSEIDDVTHRIGQNVAELVQDGATLQMGIGKIPDAVLGQLTNHRDLGVHTEMFSDGMLKLMESGAVTNAKKRYYSDRVVSTFAYGTRALYDYLDDNVGVAMLRVSKTNNPGVIQMNDRVTAINSAIEIDLTGQVCADSIGTQIFSGVGGQVDFVTAASRSKEGKAIIALPSKTKNGDSKIVFGLKQGAGVVTTRAHVHHVVTEYGSVNLFGKNLWERAEALISIAAPEHRDELANQLRKRAPEWEGKCWAEKC